MLRDIYAVLFKHHHILPDEAGRQNPWVLFKMLDALREDSETKYTDDYLKMFYGKEVA